MYRPSSRCHNLVFEENGTVLQRFRARGNANCLGQNCWACLQHFFVAVYIPHKYRAAPQASDTIEELESLLSSTHVHKNDCVIIAGDLNCQLRRNVQGCTGPWSMTRRNEKVGHDDEVLDLMRRFDLFAIGTKFKPRRKLMGRQSSQVQRDLSA